MPDMDSSVGSYQPKTCDWHSDRSPTKQICVKDSVLVDELSDSTSSSLRRDTAHQPTRNVDRRSLPVRSLYIAGGVVCVLMGAIGVLLPGLPTTPFLLLASWCFSRSSSRLESLLLRSRLFGPFLQDWHCHRAIRRSVRNFALALVAAMVIATCVIGSTAPVIRYSVAALASVGAVVILSLPVLPSHIAECEAAER